MRLMKFIQAIKDLYNKSAEVGLKLPFVYDGATKQPSITLMFAYITFILALVSTILLHIFDNLLTATVTSICFWVIAYVLYRIRKLDKAKIDLDDRSIEFSGDGEEKEE